MARLSKEEQQRHEAARDLLNRMRVAANLEWLDLENAVGTTIGSELGRRQLENYGRRAGAAVRAFPKHWGLLRAIVEAILMATPSQQRPPAADVAEFLKLLRCPSDELRELQHDLQQAGLPASVLRAVDRELLDAFPALDRTGLAVEEAQLQRARRRLAALREDHVLGQGDAGIAWAWAQPAPELFVHGPGRPPLFVGRSAELRHLVRLMRAEQGPVAVAIVGPPGIGKSHLAAWFAYQTGWHFEGGVFWIDSTDAATIRTNIARSAHAIHADIAPADSERQVWLMQRYWQNPLPKLIVFDNCDDPLVIQRWLPHSTDARVLITSQQQTWSTNPGITPLRLGALARSESVALLRSKHAEHADDLTGLDHVAAISGDVPLFLNLVHDTVQKHGPTVAAQLLAQSFEGGAAIPERITQMVRLNHERRRIEGQASLALNPLLERLAWFAPDIPVPVDLLAESLDGPVEAAVLRRVVYKMRETLEVEGSDDQIWMHALVAGGYRVDDDGSAQQAVERVLITRVGDANQRVDLPALQSLQAHMAAIAQTARPRRDLPAAQLAFELGRLLHNLGDYHAAEGWYDNAAQSRAQLLGQRHPDTVRVRRACGAMLLAQGRFAAAHTILESVLADDEANHGPIHLSVAWDLNLIAGALREERRDLARAETLYRRSLAIFAALPTPMPLFAAMVANNLGALLHIQSDFPTARTMYERALSGYAEAGEAAQGEALTARQNIGELLCDEGRYAEAYTFLEPLLAQSVDLRGAAHPETAVIRYLLGRAQAGLGRRSVAYSLLSQALQGLELILSADHPRLAEIRQALENL